MHVQYLSQQCLTSSIRRFSDFLESNLSTQSIICQKHPLKAGQMNVDSCSSFKLFRNASKLSLKRVFVFFPEYLMWFEQRDVPRRETRPERKTENKSGERWSMTSVQVSSTLSLSVARIFTACFSTMTRLITARLTIQLITVGASTHTHTLCSSLLHLSLTHTYTQLADCHSELWRSGQSALCDWLLWVTDCLPSCCGVTPWIVRPLSRTHFHLVTVCILLNLIFHLSYFWLQLKTLMMAHADKMNLYALKAERWIISILHKPPQNTNKQKKNVGLFLSFILSCSVVVITHLPQGSQASLLLSWKNLC